LQEKDKCILIKEVLAKKGPLRFKEIVKETGLSEPTVAKWLKRLEEKGEIARTLLPNKKGVYYILIDRKFKETKAVMGKLIEEVFYAAKNYINTYNISGFQALMFSFGEALFITIIGLANDDQMRKYATYLILDTLEKLLLPADNTEFEKRVVATFDRLYEEVSKLSNEELDEYLRKINEKILKAEEEFLKATENQIKNKDSKNKDSTKMSR